MKVVTIFLKYDYGIESRGESLEKQVFLPAIKGNVDDVVTFWLEENGYPYDKSKLQERIVSFCDEEKPDLVFFILMEYEVTIETIEYLSSKYSTVNWFCDDQWRFDDFSSKVAPYLTHILTVDKFSIDKYRNIGCSNIFLSQWATNNYLTNLDLDNVLYKYDVSFVGGKNLTREWIIYELEEKGIKVNCFGQGWTNGRVSLAEMNNIFRTSRINLNLSNSQPRDIRFYIFLVKRIFLVWVRKGLIKNKLRTVYYSLRILFGRGSAKNIEQIKARNFEIPGAGGLILSQYPLGIEDYYSIGEDMAIFTTIDELYLQIQYYLANSDIRKKIAFSGYTKSSEYTYANRLKCFFKGIEK